VNSWGTQIGSSDYDIKGIDSYIIGATTNALLSFNTTNSVDWEGSNPSMIQICGDPETLFGNRIYGMKRLVSEDYDPCYDFSFIVNQENR